MRLEYLESYSYLTLKKPQEGNMAQSPSPGFAAGFINNKYRV